MDATRAEPARNNWRDRRPRALGRNCLTISLYKMAKVKLGWSMLTVPQKIVKANSVMTTMAANAAVYVTPDPPLADIDSAIGALAGAESEAIKGGVDRTIARNARLAELTALMLRLVDYVQLTSEGDPEKISMAGMEVKSPAAPWPLPFPVQNLQAVPGGNPGTVVLTWDAAKYMKSYVVEMWIEGGIKPPDTPSSSTSDGAWEVVVIQGKRSFTVVGLTSGTNYRFRVAAQNSAGMGSYSDEAQSVAR